GETYYRITEQNAAGLTIEFEFAELQTISSGNSTDQVWTFELPGLTQNYNSGDPLLPVIGLPLALPQGKSKLNITVHEMNEMPGYFPLLFIDEPAVAVDASAKTSPVAEPGSYRQLFPAEFVELHEMGMMRDNRIGSLQIYPVQATPSGVRFYKKFTVHIKFDGVQTASGKLSAGEKGLLGDLVVNKQQLDYSYVSNATQLKSTAPGYMKSTFGSRYRIIIDEDGLYKITGADLEEAGVRLSDVNVAAMRLSNRNRDVAFYLFGDEDGSLDEVDFLEFWGERNERTFIEEFPDQYSDPFSNENVYWLEWGSRAGNRMVEENGSLTSIVPGDFNPAFNFRETVHHEQNNTFERLGRRGQETLSYTSDNWFFDSGIRAVGKNAYPFQLDHPDNSSFNNVIVEAMFAGKSFGAVFNDGNPQTDDKVPHNVQLWLNNGFVGNGPLTWFNQDTARISNATSSTIRNSDLVHGTNVMEVQLPKLPDITIQVNGQTIPSKGTDIVLLNWFQVTYDKLYLAENNVLEFRRPSFIPFPNTDLFRFELDGFRRPDVEIYKKGISRIVNFKIEDIIRGEFLEYKISFQDEVVTDDVEYIALTPDMKKKPLRIELDLPPDEENPNLVLQDAANNAEYLIITNRTFLQGARELLAYRESQGVAARLISVQDIYDEFNFGIKSPLAIREFLRYAFFNWQRSPRLKYVVLLGDATFDYKSKSDLDGDFVPTYFYQTDLFGASASDYPYALISGDDDIPDLAVGRIPANTNSDIQNYVAKLIEYDQADVTLPWQSQALFISGNDRSTYELQNRFGEQFPAFRTQNSRVISTLMPKHLSSSRLNTIRDESLPPNEFDPNFGTRTTLIDRWNDGLMFINFMGHGGGGIWADVNLMDIPDVELLNNKGRYPFITSMTCFTGSFENPLSEGLAERLVIVPDKGAIGVLASSGLGYLHNDYTMLWFFGQFLFNGSRSIGESLLLGKTLYWNNGGYNVNGRVYGTPGYSSVRHEMVYQYNYIGDPMTLFRWTPRELDVQISNPTPQRGETVALTVNSPLNDGEGYVELVDRSFNVVERQPLLATGQTTSLSIEIPDDFPDGTGLFRVYLADGTRSVGGNVSLGVNYGVISDLTIIPEAPRVDDSVKVQIRALDVTGLSRVYVIPETNIDTIFAVVSSSDPNLYTVTMPPTFRLKTVFFNVYLENTSGNVSVFSNQSYIVTDQRADILFTNNSLRFTGRKKTQLKVGLTNLAGAGADNEVKVNVRAFEGQQNYTSDISFAEGSAVLRSLDTTSVLLDFNLPLTSGQYDIVLKAELAPGEDITDFNSSNDTLRQEIAASIFNVSPSAGLDTVKIRNRFRVSFPPTSLSDSSAVQISLRDFEAPAAQSGLTPISLLNADIFTALDVALLNPEAQVSGSYTVEIDLNATLIDSNATPPAELRLYEKRSAAGPWTFIQSEYNADKGRLTVRASRSGSYAIFFSDDNRPPTIELTADGRPLRDRGLVDSTPSLYLVLQDASGIDTNRDRIEILLDGQPFPEDKLFIPDSVSRNDIVGLTMLPELDEGIHDLTINVRDVNGLSQE
ncbi:MAG: C25 family cysteine peptidase, partial [Calditrichota bacterium]